MTIAACYRSSEGIVFGTDSTATWTPPNPQGLDISVRHFNHAQKIFELGSNSPIGPMAIVAYGLGDIGPHTHRGMAAIFADELEADPPKAMEEVAARWSGMVWKAFSTIFSAQIARAQALSANQSRTPLEQEELQSLGRIGGGYFLGGRLARHRETFAYQIEYNIHSTSDPRPILVPIGGLTYAGCPQAMMRLIMGHDPRIVDNIMASGNWKGSRDELVNAMRVDQYYPGAVLNIRDAVDLVYSMLYTTIKALRFSQSAPLCGGPIEIAAITLDRPFRWVFHKDLDVAVRNALHNET